MRWKLVALFFAVAQTAEAQVFIYAPAPIAVAPPIQYYVPAAPAQVAAPQVKYYVPATTAPAAAPPEVKYYVPAAPAQATTRIERYYFSSSAAQDSRYFPPRNSSEEGEAAKGGVIIREYYYQNAEPAARSTPSIRSGAAQPPLEELKETDSDKAGAAKNARPADAKDIQPEPEPEPEKLQKLKDMPDPKNGSQTAKAAEAASGAASADGMVELTGSLKSGRGGMALADMELEFFHRDAKFQDRSTKTDRNGNFKLALEPGSWLVYWVYPDGGRRFLQIIKVEPTGNGPMSLSG